MREATSLYVSESGGAAASKAMGASRKEKRERAIQTVYPTSAH
jgi:hypothetical protein